MKFQDVCMAWEVQICQEGNLSCSSITLERERPEGTTLPFWSYSRVKTLLGTFRPPAAFRLWPSSIYPPLVTQTGHFCDDQHAYHRHDYHGADHQSQLWPTTQLWSSKWPTMSSLFDQTRCVACLLMITKITIVVTNSPPLSLLLIKPTPVIS